MAAEVRGTSTNLYYCKRNVAIVALADYITHPIKIKTDGLQLYPRQNEKKN
jgi:hypothetical protein